MAYGMPVGWQCQCALYISPRLQKPPVNVCYKALIVRSQHSSHNATRWCVFMSVGIPTGGCSLLG